MKQHSVWKEQLRRQKNPNSLQETGKKRKRGGKPIFQGSNEEVLASEAEDLYTRHDLPPSTSPDPADGEAPKVFSEIELDVLELSSSGDGLALRDSHVYTVPFAVPGDKVLAEVLYHQKGQPYTATNFINVLMASSQRDDSAIKCQYFSKCSGCQLQMLPYPDQLAHKKAIIERAYRSFSGLSPSEVPPVQDTIGSPLQYGYRTKLTPHFDGAFKAKKSQPFESVPPIGFTQKGRKKVMDIERCPIGTPIVQEGMTRERDHVAKNFHTYKTGATILIRETTERIPKTQINGTTTSTAEAPSPSETPTTTMIYSADGHPTLVAEHTTYTERKSYTSDNQGPSTEYIDSTRFDNNAGSFFQNNNSILSTFVAYIRSIAPGPPSSITSTSQPAPLKYLLDAYCGSGLFSITLSPLFAATLGIDIAPTGIQYARLNAAHLAGPEPMKRPNIGFIEADAPTLFSNIPFPPHQTLLIIDPPRKGCSMDFLQQLLAYAPARVVYVSCNVHTQARDVGILSRGVAEGVDDDGEAKGSDGKRGKSRTGAADTAKARSPIEELEALSGGGGGTTAGRDAAPAVNPEEQTRNKVRYSLESLQGFDFFPQTGHVESVAVLNRVVGEGGLGGWTEKAKA